MTGTPSFNPLHCGAVVASPWVRGLRHARHGEVSIPFIAGQWSLPYLAVMEMSRSLRFNPLHCGAVVASQSAHGVSSISSRFQSPSLRGSGRFRSRFRRIRAAGGVSIPFIAGQWSLQGRQATPTWSITAGVSIPFIAGQWSLPYLAVMEMSRSLRFNPLHCGAVVASAWGMSWPHDWDT
jgi:hypothetical protein